MRQSLQITMYVYSSKVPATELLLLRCIRCTRPLFRVNSKKIVLSNAYGASYKEFPPYSNYIEHQCHSCSAVYQILFQ